MIYRRKCSISMLNHAYDFFLNYISNRAKQIPRTITYIDEHLSY